MTTVEHGAEEPSRVGGQPVVEEPRSEVPTVAVAATPVRERFGGSKLGAAFFGWLVALGMTVLLTGVVALVVAALGRNLNSVPFVADAADVGLSGMGTAAVVLVVAYFFGGYVAGRLARFDGARNGLLTWLLGLIVAVLAAVAATVVGANTDLAATVHLPTIPFDVAALTVSGAVVLAITVVGTALTAALGGRLGERFHRRVDRAAGLDLR
ncbi:MAG TPA: hypothetical protein VGE11_24870 [Pseudonocardia sp.]